MFRLSIVFLCALVLGASSLNAKEKSLETLTYAEAAKTFVAPAFKKLETQLVNIDKDTLPHEIKVPVDLRKAILIARDVMDLFAFAMPDSTLDNQDAFLYLRKDLDKGYETFGAYKDLYDIQDVEPDAAKYDKDQVKEVRRKVLKWRDEFFSRFDAYKRYLAQIKRDTLIQRDRSDLSQFYWGASSVTPEPEETAASSFRRLLYDLLDVAGEEWPEVRKIKNPTNNVDNIEMYHDFRKRMRTVLKIDTYFPELMKLNAGEKSFLAELSRQYGIISDQVAAMENALHNKDKKKAKKISEKTEKLWKDLQDWEDSEDVQQRIEDLKRSLG